MGIKMIAENFDPKANPSVIPDAMSRGRVGLSA